MQTKDHSNNITVQKILAGTSWYHLYSRFYRRNLDLASLCQFTVTNWNICHSRKNLGGNKLVFKPQYLLSSTMTSKCQFQAQLMAQWTWIFIWKSIWCNCGSVIKHYKWTAAWSLGQNEISTASKNSAMLISYPIPQTLGHAEKGSSIKTQG